MGSIRKSPRNPARWEARYRDRQGRQRTQVFDSRASAKAWLAETEADLRRGKWIDPRFAAIKLAVVAGHWLNNDRRKRPGSVARDQSILKTHVLPTLGNMGIGSITRSDIQQLVDTWTKSRAASSVHRQYACLRGLFTYAERCELIVRSPCRDIRLPEVSPREATILDAASLERLAGALGDAGPMAYLAAMGLRWGEIAGLRVGSLDLTADTVTVSRQRTRGTKGKMVEQDPKTRTSKRTLSIPPWLTTMLGDHLRRRAVDITSHDELVFVSPDGEPLHYSNWRRRIWRPAVEQVGLQDLTFHDLKHTAATLLVEGGVDIKTAQNRLGHASPQTTLRIYAQATNHADRAAADVVGDRLRPAAPVEPETPASPTGDPAR